MKQANDGYRLCTTPDRKVPRLKREIPANLMNLKKYLVSSIRWIRASIPLIGNQTRHKSPLTCITNPRMKYAA